MSLHLARVGPEAAPAVLGVVHGAFAARPPLDPPADAMREDLDTIGAALSRGGGVLATLDSAPVGALLLDPDDDGTLWLRRVGVLPAARVHGIAGAMIGRALWEAAGYRRIAVLAREELPATVAFWRHEGFTEVGRHAPYVELERPGPAAYEVPTGEDMAALGERLGRVLRAGDLVVLTGGLGAGKTTLTQGLGAGLGVRPGITSPTFVISRVHPSLGSGPALVHVDAYRLGGAVELDDLDLDASLDEAVTVVEWGAGIADALAESRLEVRIARATGAAPAGGLVEGPDVRRVLLAPVGPRWASGPLVLE